MKRLALPLFSCLLVLTLLLGSFSTANAAAGDPPVITPVSGDMEFTTEIIPIASLPGTTELANQMLVPVGFPAGEAQYEGSGVLVKGMDSGKATACFTITGTEVGWGGKVGLWNGTKWVLLSTTITPPTETPNSIACATITGSGTYAFIRWVAEPDKLPVSFSVPSCGPMASAGPLTASFGFTSGWMTEGYIWRDPIVAVGTPITYQIMDVVPAGTFYTGLSGSGVVTSIEEVVPGIFISIVTFDPMVTFTYSNSMDTFTYRVFTPECYTDFHFPDDLLTTLN